MKKVMIAVIVALFATSLVFAPFAVAGPQQDKMKACNKEATEKKLTSEERQKFMKECLKAKPAAATSQQDKMKACNKEATKKKLKGEARKKFMSECLKAK